METRNLKDLHRLLWEHDTYLERGSACGQVWKLGGRVQVRCVESMLNNEIFQSIKPDFGTFCLCGHKKYIDNFLRKSLTERHNDNNISILKIII